MLATKALLGTWSPPAYRSTACTRWAARQMTSCQYLFPQTTSSVILQAAFPALNPVGSVRDNLHRHSMQQIRDLGAAAEFFPSAREVGAVPHLVERRVVHLPVAGSRLRPSLQHLSRACAAHLASAHAAQHV